MNDATGTAPTPGQQRMGRIIFTAMAIGGLYSAYLVHSGLMTKGERYRLGLRKDACYMRFHSNDRLLEACLHGAKEG
jgi:hypothetical protein